MKSKTLLLNAFHYAAADWYNVIILGLILLLTDNLNSLPGNPSGIDAYDITVWLIIMVLIFLEAGYFFRIIKETLNGSVNPPKLCKLHKMFFHGVKEVIVFFIYFSIPVIILFLAAFDFTPYLRAIFLNPHIFAHYLIIDIIYYYLIPSIIPGHFDPRFVTFLLAALTTSIMVYFIFLCALLNMAHYNGTIRSGLDINRIIKRLIEVGVTKLVVVYIFLGILVLLIGAEFFAYASDLIPIIFGWDMGDILVQLVVIPYFLIFTFRILGLIDRPHQTVDNLSNT